MVLSCHLQTAAVGLNLAICLACDFFRELGKAELILFFFLLYFKDYLHNQKKINLVRKNLIAKGEIFNLLRAVNSLELSQCGPAEFLSLHA